MAASTLLCFAVVCLSFLAANGLKCYSCKDDYHYGLNASIMSCLDEGWDPETGENDQQEPVECETDQNACSKIYSMNYDVIKGQKVLVTRLVKRNCTEVPEEELGCTYYKGSAAYSYRCYCTEDGCNSANLVHLPVSFLVCLISLAFLGTRI